MMLGNPLLLGDDGYQIQRSVRLRSSNSAYFRRVPSSTGNRQKFTWSGWVKRGTLGAIQNLFSVRNSDEVNLLRFTATDTIQFLQQNAALGIDFSYSTNAVYRDTCAWYHFVYSVDTTNTTAANRVLLYVNGVLQSLTASTTAAQNINTFYNLASYTNDIGSHPTQAEYFDGYITEINFIDGQALTPSSFGQNDPVTGVWRPKKYSGTYGTNGFYLNFKDPSSTTTIGYDYSGNGNHWTSSGVSVTAGVTYDSMVDVPTIWADGGNGRGNYPTFNPLSNLASVPMRNANLNIQSGNATHRSVQATQAFPSTGKWYFEVLCTFSGGSGAQVIGIVKLGDAISSTYVGGTANSYGYSSNGNKYNNATGSAYGATWTTADLIGVAVDCDTGALTFYKNGTSQGVAFSGLTLTDFVAVVSINAASDDMAINFGQRPFAYTPPTGFKSLNTFNLPDSTIKKGNQYFDATTYTGNGATQNITGLNFQPDFVWIKSRAAARHHHLFDLIRGANKPLYTNVTNAEATTTDTLTSFNSNGYSLGADAGVAGVNVNADTYVGWQWKAGGTAVTNNAGSISSQVSANTTAGFSIVTYTGTGVNATVGHGLGVAPKMVIVKNRTGALDGWAVYNVNIGAANYLDLHTTAASAAGATVWNSTAPTSTVFSIGTSSGVNTASSSYVAYCFAEVDGYSKFGSYTGNGSTDGTFVYCGFRPRFLLVKRTDAGTGYWYIFDTARNTGNLNSQRLYPNDAAAEGGPDTFGFDTLSNGVKVRTTDTSVNASGGTFIFAAFAENPFKNSLAR